MRKKTNHRNSSRKEQMLGNSSTNATCAIWLFILVILFTGRVYTQTKRPLSPDDAIRIARVGDVLMTPDGGQIFYSIARLDWDKNKTVKTFYMTTAKGEARRRFIGKAGGEDFQFSPNGRYLSFVREVEKSMQLFLIPVAGGEAIQQTNHKGGISSYKWSSDNKRLFFVAKEIRGEEEEKEWKKGADAYYVDEGPNGKSAGAWSNLWVFETDSKKETRLTQENFIIGDFDVSPDSKHIVLAARTNARQNYPHLSELYLYSTDAKSLKRLTNNRAPEGDLNWAPDGKSFLYRSPDGENFELSNGYFWLMDPKTGKRRQLSAQKRGDVDHIVWTPDSRGILFNEVHGTNVNLYRLDVEQDTMIPVTNKTGTFRALAYSKDRQHIVYSFSDFNTPANIFASNISLKNQARLTDANPWVKKEIALAKGEVIQWKSKDGTEIEGILAFPANFKKGKRVPLMVDIHGGPGGYFGNSFDSFFQLYAGIGYIVLGPNVRGSSGYGDKLQRGLMGDVGGGEYEDLMSGVDYLIKRGDADPDRLGVRGWSWGGVSCGWVITHTNRFKAASCGAGVYSWQAESGPGFNFDLSLWYIGGTAWTKPEEWRKHSALTYVKNVKTPTLLLHGSRDTTSSTNQSMVFYTALRDLGVPTRFIKFPRQGHGIREPRLRRIQMVEEMKWMQKYVLGKKWSPPAKRRKLP